MLSQFLLPVDLTVAIAMLTLLFSFILSVRGLVLAAAKAASRRFRRERDAD